MMKYLGKGQGSNKIRRQACFASLDDMKETMINADGIGLAAPQVGLLRRAAIIDADGVYLEMINPKIIKAEGEQIGVEGCLSVNPSKNCKVLRPQEVLLEAYDRHGKKISERA